MANTITTADLARVQDIEFVNKFNGSARSLLRILGQTSPIVQNLGTQIKVYKTSGTLESGDVAEGAEIPVSKYENKLAATYALDVQKYAKETTVEAVLTRGYDQAVDATDEALIRDIQKKTKKSIMDFLATGTGKASGATFQEALANSWGELTVAFEDDDATPVYFCNPLDVADYLATANVTMQTAFGMSYLQNFLGLGTVVVDSGVPKGKAYATATENVNVYYANMAQVPGFQFYSDETGYCGVAHDPRYENGTYRTYVDTALKVFPEYLDRIVVATIGATPAGSSK